MKLKASQIKGVRLDLLKRQGNRCALCGLDLPVEKAVLDHDHKTGYIRSALHRGCNSLLGKNENNYRRYGVDLFAFADGLGQYLRFHSVDRTGLEHPSHGKPKRRKRRV